MEPEPLKLFIIYSNNDEPYLKQLLLHLNALVRKGLIEQWNATKLLGGDHWEERILDKLNDSELTLVLVSAHSLDSEYIQQVEMKVALQQQSKGATRVVPILLRDCLWEEETSLKSLQILPRREGIKGPTPIVSKLWSDPDQAWASVCRDLMRLVKEIQEKARTLKEERPARPPAPKPETASDQSGSKFDVRSRKLDADAWALTLDQSELSDSPEEKIAAFERYLETPNIPLLHADEALEMLSEYRNELRKTKISDRKSKEKTKNDEENWVAIKSPMVGTFYRSTSVDKAPLVKVGDEVTWGTTVCIIEAMKLFNEIESDVKGNIVKILVEDGSPVEYDQPLFLVSPA